MAIRNKGSAWVVYAEYKGQRKSQTCATEAEAREVEAALLKAMGKTADRSTLCLDKPAERGTLAAVFAACCRLDWAGQAPDMPKLARGVVRYWGEGTAPSAIDEYAIDEFVGWLRRTGFNGKGCSNGTIRSYLSALRTMLKRAQRLRLISGELPMFPETRLLALPEPRQLVLEEDWYCALLEELERMERRQERRLTVFLWHMGCRVGEALSLTWDRVNLTSGTILFSQTKGRRARRLPLPRVLRPVLQGQESSNGSRSDRVFPFSYETYLSVYSRAVDACCDRLGLGEEVRKCWVIHTLRHTCLTRLAREGWSGPQLQAWGGHQSMQVTERYVHGSGITLEHLVET